LIDGNEVITDPLDSNANIPHDIPEAHLFEFTNLSIDVVMKILKNVNKSKAPGPDGISNTILSNIAVGIAPALTTFFNFSIATGTFPQKWKPSNIVPIFKNKGDKANVKNYRPISLLHCLSKIFERLIVNQLNNHLKLNKLLYEKQAGFQTDDFTINQLIICSDKIIQALEEGKEVRTVFLDISRAFDRAWYKGLLFELRCIGIEGNL
jgi:hypothetical protein